jgi:hypothetical protein
MRLDERLHAVVIDVADRHHDEVAGDVGVVEVAFENVVVEGGDALGRAEDRAPERVAVPVRLREDLVHEIVRRVLDHLDLFEDDLLLAGDVLRRKDRVRHQIGEHVHGERQVLVEHLDVIPRIFLRGERVELAADRVHLLRDVLGGAGGRALEQHVLDEVGDAGMRERLVTRPARQPHANRHRPHVRHRFGYETETVGEGLASDGGLAHSSK